VSQIAPLAIFDLDNTLIAGDSDHLWGEFLVEQGLVDADEYRRGNDLYYAQYVEGTLDIFEFLVFSLAPLARIEHGALMALRERFVIEKIHPIMLPAAEALVEKHRQAGDMLMIITATNSFITRPIADLLGIDTLIATEPEIQDGRYTGAVEGAPCFKEGKVERLRAWLAGHDIDLANSSFYSDSHNDLPLLRLVGRPVAVDPDDKLRDYALDADWPLISLR